MDKNVWSQIHDEVLCSMRQHPRMTGSDWLRICRNQGKYPAVKDWKILEAARCAIRLYGYTLDKHGFPCPRR